jgi:hypothetical protein
MKVSIDGHGAWSIGDRHHRYESHWNPFETLAIIFKTFDVFPIPDGPQ